MFLVKWRIDGDVFISEEKFESSKDAQIKADKIQSAINTTFGFLPTNGAWFVKVQPE